MEEAIRTESTCPAGARVLVCDDDPVSRTIVGHLLVGKLGCSVVASDNGADGLHRLVLDGPWDLAVVDINMPHLDGVALVKIAREVPALKHLHVVMLTVDGRAHVVRELLGLGVADYILKPIVADVALAKFGPFARAAPGRS